MLLLSCQDPDGDGASADLYTVNGADAGATLVRIGRVTTMQPSGGVGLADGRVAAAYRANSHADCAMGVALFDGARATPLPVSDANGAFTLAVQGSRLYVSGTPECGGPHEPAHLGVTDLVTHASVELVPVPEPVPDGTAAAPQRWMAALGSWTVGY